MQVLVAQRCDDFPGVSELDLNVSYVIVEVCVFGIEKHELDSALEAVKLGSEIGTSGSESYSSP